MAIVRTLMTIALLGVLAACSAHADASAPPATTSSTSHVRHAEPVDARLPVGPAGARMHLVCRGSGDRTVLLLAGFGGSGTESWTKVAPVLEAETRVCAVDRLGLGTSDAPAGTETFDSQVEEVATALDEAGEHGPYMVVGHSFGGAQAVAFAASHPDQVDGVVLVDASPTDWTDAACQAPGDEFARTCAMFDPAGNPERLDARASFAEVAAIDSLGDVPLRVLTRADVAYPDLGPDASHRLASAWHGGQERWAALSTDAEVIPVENTGHAIQDDQPAAVVEQILALV